MNAIAYRACADELEKIAVGFTVPGLKMLKTKIKSHVVRTSSVSKKAVTQKPTVRAGWGTSPSKGVANLGSAHGVQPPAVRL